VLAFASVVPPRLPRISTNAPPPVFENAAALRRRSKIGLPRTRLRASTPANIGAVHQVICLFAKKKS
jgi:hypothetical protein